jgi:hypothetical protein
MTTHEYNNDTDQHTRREVLRDSYLTRAQSDADLTSQGRFKRETATRVTGVPTYPSLPASSPWSGAFDENVEPPLGFAVDEMPAVGTPNEIQDKFSADPINSSALPAVSVGDRAGEEPAVGDVSFVASQAAGSSIKRRGW